MDPGDLAYREFRESEDLKKSISALESKKQHFADNGLADVHIDSYSLILGGSYYVVVVDPDLLPKIEQIVSVTKKIKSGDNVRVYF